MLDLTEWMDRAECRGSIDFFFPSGAAAPTARYKLTVRDQLNRRIALAMCKACPVIEECTDYARRLDLDSLRLMLVIAGKDRDALGAWIKAGRP